MNDTTKEASASTSPSSSTHDRLSAFERWRRTAMLVTGLGVSKEESMEYLRYRQTQHCEQRKEYLMEYSPIVVFMLKQLKLSGCEVPRSNVYCIPCVDSNEITHSGAGGFTPIPGAVHLCSGRFFSQNHQETTLVHELMHMYDHCRFKVDWTNLRHHACSEIRANSLSGDCTFRRELRRGNFSFSKQHQDCVRVRAIESVASNAACPSPADAERAVNEVWDSCFNDTRPFDEIY